MNSILRKLGKNAAGWASGINWWKYGAYAVVLTSLMSLSYYGGKHNCEIAHEKQKTEQAEVKLQTVVKEVQVRVPVVQTREVESAKQRAAIEALRKELDNATKQRPENPSCDLSDAEFNLVRELAAKTHAPK